MQFWYSHPQHLSDPILLLLIPTKTHASPVHLLLTGCSVSSLPLLEFTRFVGLKNVIYLKVEFIIIKLRSV